MANTFLQKVVVNSHYGTDVAALFSNPCTPGSTIVVSTEASSDTPITVDDPTNGGYAEDKKGHRTYDNFPMSIWSHPNTSNVALTVTVHFASLTYWSFVVYEIATPPSTSYVDTAATDNTHLLPQVPISPSTDHTTVIAAGMLYSGFQTGADAGFTNDNYDAIYCYFESNPDIGVAGTYTLNFGGSSGNLDPSYEVMLAVAYKSSGGGGVANYEYTGNIALTAGVASPSFQNRVYTGAIPLTLAVAAKTFQNRVYRGTCALSLAIASAIGRDYACSGSIVLTLGVNSPSTFVSNHAYAGNVALSLAVASPYSDDKPAGSAAQTLSVSHRPRRNV